MERISYVGLEDAQRAVTAWGGVVVSLEHVGNAGSSVFRFVNEDGVVQFLRITDATFRTQGEVEAELEFLAHLKKEHVSVAAGVRNRKGKFTTEYAAANGMFVGSVIENAGGVPVRVDSPYWNKNLWRAWGRNLGEIHRAGEHYVPPKGTSKLWQWDEEIIFRYADATMPEDDVVSRKELRELRDALAQMDRSAETYGITHADHSPQNFHYLPERGEIVAFDFGNACYHWFVSDVAIALTTFRKTPEREEIKRELLAGYREVKALPDKLEELIPIFVRLRTMYVYLDRLYWFGDEPNEKQREILAGLAERVRTKAEW